MKALISLAVLIITLVSVSSANAGIDIILTGDLAQSAYTYNQHTTHKSVSTFIKAEVRTSDNFVSEDSLTNLDGITVVGIHYINDLQVILYTYKTIKTVSGKAQNDSTTIPFETSITSSDILSGAYLGNTTITIDDTWLDLTTGTIMVSGTKSLRI